MFVKTAGLISFATSKPANKLQMFRFFDLVQYSFKLFRNRQNYCSTNLVLLLLGLSEGGQNLHNR